jgi:hypothetical protein
MAPGERGQIAFWTGANETRRETEGAVKGRRRGGRGAGVFAGQVGIG